MRKIALGLALSSVLASNSHAVGLGEIVTSSSLNQPLNASIELVDTTSGDVDDLEVTLAPTAVFDQVGIARSSALEKLEFIPTVENGVPTIKVTSLQPIQEPFLNFVLEVTWANGKLLREYTVLLDPPVFSDTQYAATPATLPVMDETLQETAQAVPEATPFVETVLAEPEVMAAPIDAVADSGLDPFVSIPDAGIGAVAGVEAFDVATDSYNYQGLETYPVEGDEGIPEAVAFTEVFTDDGDVFVESTGQELPTFVDSIPLESPSDVAAYTDGLAGEYAAVNYEDYAYEDTLPVEDIAMSLEGVDEIFTEPTGGDVVYNEGDIFVAEPQPYTEQYAAESYQIARGDTLGSIARELTDPGSVSQMMVGLMRNNPEAFIKNNMNLIKSGYVMRVPDADEVASISRKDALAEIASHTSSWSKYRTDVASTALPQMNSDRLAGIEDLVGLDRDALAAVPEVTVESDSAEISALAEVSDLVVKPVAELEILIPSGEGDAVEGDASTGSGAIGNLTKELALSKEQLVSATGKNDELRSRVSELESLLSSKNRLIELKNEQLSDLQGQMAEARSQLEEQAQSATQVVEGKVEETTEKVTETAKGLLPRTEMAAADERPFTGLEPNKKTEPEVAEVTTKVAEADTKTPAPVVDEPENSSLVEDVKDNPNLLMGLGFGGLLLAALGWLVLRRKDESEYVAPEVATPLSPTMAADTAEAVEKPIDDTLDVISETTLDVQESALEPALSENDSADLEELVLDEPELPVSSVDEDQAGIEDEDEVMSEANVYLAYGLQDQAVDLLKPVVADNPERIDYSLKLLEAYQSTDAKDDFLELAQKVHGQIDNPEASSEWSTVAVMGKSLLPGNSLFEGVDTGDLSMTQIRTKPPELADVNFSPDDSLTGDSLENTISEMKEEVIPDSSVDQVTEIDASELAGLSTDLEKEFDSEIDLSGDEALDTLRNTKIDIDGKELDDAFGDIELDTDDLDIDNLSLKVDDELVAPSEIIDPSEHASNLEIPTDERLNLDTLVGDEVDEGLFSTGEDEISTKLDLAKAYLDMGDDEGAREALEEVITLGSPAQRDEAAKLKDQLT